MADYYWGKGIVERTCLCACVHEWVRAWVCCARVPARVRMHVYVRLCVWPACGRPQPAFESSIPQKELFSVFSLIE